MGDCIVAQLRDYNNLIWGGGEVKSDLFSRWCQGFYFSPTEVSALIQETGGPCAVIATTQAAVLCEILFLRKQKLADITDVDNLEVLLSALLRILMNSHNVDRTPLYWVYWCDDNHALVDESPSHKNDIHQDVYGPSHFNKSSDDAAQKLPSFHNFINGLRFHEAESAEELRAVALSLLPQLSSHYGVLCFLYSVLFTHGIEALKNEMGDESDALIDPVHGHASQCLINLLITGESTPYLFDGERDLGGFTLKGISKQPDIGFLTYIEAMRYCEVGWFLKNPYYPIWILGSETHLTVLASPDTNLVYKFDSSTTNADKFKSNVNKAEMEFNHISPDQDTGGFISTTDLELLINKLKISITLPINELIATLDPENLGIVLKKDFLRHFFPEEMAKNVDEQRDFHLIHYNGLERSNFNGKVCYNFGEARLIDPTDELVETQPVDSSPIQQCMATKWPTIRVKWVDNKIPSLN